MRIWIVNHYADPYARHHLLARELVRRGHEVGIFASGFDHRSRKENRLAPGEVVRNEVIGGVPFVWLRTPPYTGNTPARVWNMVVFAARIWVATGARLLGKPDVVIGSSPHLPAALAAERLARRYQVPFVFEVRDLWPQTLVDLGRLSARHPLVRGLEWVERYLYRRAARIISLLPGAADHMAAKGADRNRVVWIPNGVDFGLVPPPEPPPEDGVFTLMYAGAHGFANALDTLLDTAKILQSGGWAERVRFRFVGDGPEKPRLRARAEAEGIRNVRFEDPVPRTRVYRVLQEADAFLVTLRNSPLYRWGVSLNKLYDYLAAARPVVFGADVALNPVAEAGAGLIVPPEDPEALAWAIRRLVFMSSADRWAMGLRGRRYVEKHHDFSRLANKLEELLAQVVQGGKC